MSITLLDAPNLLYKTEHPSVPLLLTNSTPQLSSYANMNMSIPPQSKYLYKGTWSPLVDTILVDTIIHLKNMIAWTHWEFTFYFLLTAAKDIHTKTSLHFTEVELADRVGTLHVRYRTLKDLVKEDGVQWDMLTRFVHAADWVWKNLCKKNSLVGAYYYHNEPIYTNLACLFGIDDVKLESDQEVIVISETTEKISFGEPTSYVAAEENDEVKSPFVIAQTNVRRKLFIETDEPEDRDSTNEKRTIFIDVDENVQLVNRVGKGKMLTKKPRAQPDAVGPSVFSARGSSCSSNSPIGSWPRFHK